MFDLSRLLNVLSLRADTVAELERLLDWKLLHGSHEFPGPHGGTCINEAAIVAAGYPYRLMLRRTIAEILVPALARAGYTQLAERASPLKSPMELIEIARRLRNSYRSSIDHCCCPRSSTLPMAQPSGVRASPPKSCSARSRLVARAPPVS